MLPGTQLPEALGGQVGEPALQAGMRFAAVRLTVVVQQIPLQPQVGFGFALWPVKVVQRFVHLLHLRNGRSTLPFAEVSNYTCRER
jgi:hypothetical protein